MNMMISKIYKIGLCLAIFGMTATGCTDDLKLEPISQISNASFWKTENDASGALNGMYVRFRSQAMANLFFWGEGRSETMDVSLGGPAGFQLLYLNELDRTNVETAYGFGSMTWQGMYTVIHDANLLLKYVPGITFSSEDKKNTVLAQAHAMRAYAYFVLTKTWGDLPLVTEPTEGYDAETIQKERSAQSAVFALIKDDIEKALSLFPNNAFQAGRNMWSRPAVNAMKGDVYLWTGKRMNGGNSDFEIALTALNEVEAADVALLDNYASIFDYENKGNKEILMAVRFQDIEASDNISIYMYMESTYMTDDTDEETKAAVGVVGGFPNWTVSELVRNQFSDEDQRKRATFIEIYNFDNAGGKSYYGSVTSKFSGTVIGGVRRFIDDVVIYRYGEVLLMIAEAKNALDQNPAAEINKIRQRAYGTNFASRVFVNSSKQVNDEAILKERLLELTLEGKRWWDLVRFNKAFDLVPSLRGRKGQEHLLLFPISEATLSLEPKVKQNPGYN